MPWQSGDNADCRIRHYLSLGAISVDELLNDELYMRSLSTWDLQVPLVIAIIMTCPASQDISRWHIDGTEVYSEGSWKYAFTKSLVWHLCELNGQ